MSITFAKLTVTRRPFNLDLRPSLGSSIEDCYDHAVGLARLLDVVVNFEFNEVSCGVRPSDFGEPERRELFVANFHRELAKPTGPKICYANPL